MTDFAIAPTEPPAPVPDTQAGGILTVDLAALAANWRLLRDRAAGAECAAVVKADAYGLGIERAVPALAAAGCTTFFVAHLAEAARVRRVNGEATVYVLNGLLPGTAPAYAQLGLRPVLGSREEIEEWVAFCRTAGRRLAAAVHVDTGMNRLGLRPDDAVALSEEADLVGGFDMALLQSHFVAAEEVDQPITARQIKTFSAVRDRFPGVPASLANSSGIFLGAKPHFELVRPGYALYGGNPVPGRENPMRPVVHLEGRIVQLRWTADGETVGYNAHWTARGRRRIATISVGYADGYLRGGSATNLKAGGEAFVSGVRCPFAGRISMDLITVDVTAVPEAGVKRGDLVTLIGDGITIDDVGARCGTIGYEVLTSLGRRYARHYVGG